MICFQSGGAAPARLRASVIVVQLGSWFFTGWLIKVTWEILAQVSYDNNLPSL